jgi:DNA processing protein
MEIDLDLVRLNLTPGITPRATAALLDRFGTAGAALSGAPGDLRGVPGVGRALAARLSDPPSEGDARREVRRAGKRGIRILNPGASDYPDPLREIPDPPTVLYVSGRLPEEGIAAAVVGARRATV